MCLETTGKTRPYVRKSLRLIDILIIWIVVMVSWIFTHIRINQIANFQNVQLSYVNYT